MDHYTETDKPAQSNGFKMPHKFRIAYSINNYQPVKSTYIAQEPLFYIDEEMPFDDDDFLDDKTFEIVERELKALGQDLSMMKLPSRENLKEERILEFLADTSFLHEESFDLNREEIKTRLIETLNQSRMAKTLLAFANKNSIAIKITDQVNNVTYDKNAQTVFVRDDLDFNDQVLLTLESLRLVWQDLNKARKHPLTFHPDHAVLVQRAQAADLKVSLVRCAWELKLAGQNQFWDHILHSPMVDLARTHARETLNDFRSLDNGKASCAVFEAWFLSERCNIQDKILIQAMLAEDNNFVFESSEASYKNLIKLIMSLGEQPYGKNYLARFVDLIVNDPLFIDVRDRSNANFLWFVKFERAYNEAEQDLQSAGVTTLPGIERAQINKDTNNEQQQTKPVFGKNIFGKQKYADNVIAVDFANPTNIKEERLF